MRFYKKIDFRIGNGQGDLYFEFEQDNNEIDNLAC